jgi:hypothetical protein
MKIDMKTTPYLYLRGLRHADHTVFCLEDEQKTYYDSQFGTKVGFSSGQQVKRSILTSVLELLGESEAPITFNFDLKGGKRANGEPWSPCDPQYTDQLLGGWMKAAADTQTVKRRSPLSISAMRALHPTLSQFSKENLTFDRSHNPNRHPVVLRDEKGNPIPKEKVFELINTGQITSLSPRTWVPDNTRVGGLFVYDIAIDLRTLFCVSTNEYEPELHQDTIEKLKAEGWITGKNIFGDCLICPKEKREKIIPALANGLINWRITSNQSRTFSLMETLAVAISYNANQLANTIRAKLKEDFERLQAEPVIDETTGAEVFIAPCCTGYVQGKFATDNTALEKAVQSITNKLLAFDYENQMK